MSGNWIAVACAAHVRRGRAGGFMQVCHGKGAPLRRIRPGDRVAYYSPTETLGGTDRLQAFTAIGIVRAGEPYAADMGDFRRFRRDVDWLAACAVPVAPLLDRLAFTRGTRNWGYQLRRGLLAIGDDDMALIAAAMRAATPPPSAPPSAPSRTAACAAAPRCAG